MTGSEAAISLAIRSAGPSNTTEITAVGAYACKTSTNTRLQSPRPPALLPTTYTSEAEIRPPITPYTAYSTTPAAPAGKPASSAVSPNLDSSGSTVVAADGLPVHPVTVEEFRIAPAETFDVIVRPRGQDAFGLFAQAMDRSGYASGTLAVRPGLRVPVPALDAPPLLTMADIGHGGHGGHGAGASGSEGMRHGMAHGGGHGMAHGGSHGMPAAAPPQGHPASEAGNPLVDMRATAPTPRLGDPGIGLRDNGRRTLTYGELRSLYPDPDGRAPGRDLEMHLTGNMERYSWTFDGIPFSGAEPVRLTYGERLRIVLVNDTMMTHPVHLHGMWSDLEDERGAFLVRKHTVDMPPGTRRSFRVRADALGRWAFHCHLLFHMAAGMFREVRVEES